MPKTKEPVKRVAPPEPTEYTCCLCGKTFKGYGNNPYPLVNDPDAKCCDECNVKVIIARMEKMTEDFIKENNI